MTLLILTAILKHSPILPILILLCLLIILIENSFLPIPIFLLYSKILLNFITLTTKDIKILKTTTTILLHTLIITILLILTPTLTLIKILKKPLIFSSNPIIINNPYLIPINLILTILLYLLVQIDHLHLNHAFQDLLALSLFPKNTIILTTFRNYNI